MNLSRAIFSFITVLFSLPLFAEYNSLGVPDSSEIRREISREWFEGSLEDLRAARPEIRTNAVGIQFQVRLEEQQDEFLVIVAPKTQTIINVYDSAGMHETKEDTYNMDSPGAWLLVRDKQSGEAKLVRYYFASDPGVYVQFRPNKSASFADMLILENYAARSVPLGVPFRKFWTASLAEIQEMTKKTLPWNYVQNRHENYDETLVMIQTVRKNLDGIAYADDAAYDEEGKPVSIQRGGPRIIPENLRDKITLSSTGFVKWICDGIVEPLAGSYLKLRPLIQETVTLNPVGTQGVFAARYNSNMSLDWTRNLAAAVMSVSAGKTILYKDSGVDVTEEPFAATFGKNGIQNAAGYVPNSGYQIQYLKPLLYVLAATRPQYFYLAAIRQTDFSRTPELKVFNEAAAIFPYFDKEGKFRARVFYAGREYSLDQFCDIFYGQKTGENFVHLTRVKASAKFYPMERAE